MSLRIVTACLICLSGGVAFAAADDSTDIDFAKQIQPILKAKCYKCHGADKQESGLRLDNKQAALDGGDNGKVIVPNSADESLLVELISGDDPDRVMPPEQTLSNKQIELLKKWIDGGADWPDEGDDSADE